VRESLAANKVTKSTKEPEKINGQLTSAKRMVNRQVNPVTGSANILRAVFSPLVYLHRFLYLGTGSGRAENRSRRKPGEESPNSTGRDAA